MAATLVAAAAWQRRAESPARWRAVATIAPVYAAAIGGSRVYLGVHWPTDVLAGWTLGTGWSLLAQRGWPRPARTAGPIRPKKG